MRFKKTLLVGLAAAAVFAGGASAQNADPGVGAGAANLADPSGGAAQAQVVDPGGSSVSYAVKRSLAPKKRR